MKESEAIWVILKHHVCHTAWHWPIQLKGENLRKHCQLFWARNWQPSWSSTWAGRVNINTASARYLFHHVPLIAPINKRRDMMKHETWWNIYYEAWDILETKWPTPPQNIANREQVRREKALAFANRAHCMSTHLLKASIPVPIVGAVIGGVAGDSQPRKDRHAV